ncbi:MAG: 4-diphosphocytidyl-2C-methyl-D-erythritol kinase [Rhodospirillaceae bacterium]|nr:MAG: 4-diphosphocytidyl-2C-methyl-D-erythritol kinase [Rhodospirillaceae bacterium]
MKFGVFPIDQAAGVILAHSYRRDGLTIRKGRVLTPDDVAALRGAGVTEIIGARLAAGDVAEDNAAKRIAVRLAGAGTSLTDARTGRCNIEAAADGIVRVDVAAVTATNHVDESVTVATLPDKQAVRKGQVLATVKIIPFAVSPEVMAGVESGLTTPAVTVAPYISRRFALISTLLPGLKPSVVASTESLTSRRVGDCQGTLAAPMRCAHQEAAVVKCLRDGLAGGAEIILIAAASATADRGDVIPAAIVAAGGVIDHFGMPVDPGNLLVLAHIGDTPVLVLPGCARSPKLNGFDWVLQRLAAGVAVTRDEIMGMGVGGLLVDTPARPLPRDSAVRSEPKTLSRVAAIVLAAGRSRRMGGDNKLTRPVGGTALVRRTVEAVLGSRARPVVVVTGHDAGAVRNLLAGLDVTIVHNPDYAEGLSTSLRAGLDALPGDVDGTLVCLADMPAVASEHIDALIAGFDPANARAIGVPTHAGKRGNPSLWARTLFDDMRSVSGDVGARHLIGANESLVYEVEFDDTAVLTDLDTPAQWSDYLSRVTP